MANTKSSKWWLSSWSECLNYKSVCNILLTHGFIPLVSEVVSLDVRAGAAFSVVVWSLYDCALKLPTICWTIDAMAEQIVSSFHWLLQLACFRKALKSYQFAIRFLKILFQMKLQSYYYLDLKKKVWEILYYFNLCFISRVVSIRVF